MTRSKRQDRISHRHSTLSNTHVDVSVCYIHLNLHQVLHKNASTIKIVARKRILKLLKRGIYLNNSYIYMTHYGLHGPSRFPALQNFTLLHSVQTESGAHPASYPIAIDVLSSGVKRPGREADHSPPLTTKGKNGGDITPLLHTSSWHSA
jgi:hypothetical protein